MVATAASIKSWCDVTAKNTSHLTFQRIKTSSSAPATKSVSLPQGEAAMAIPSTAIHDERGAGISASQCHRIVDPETAAGPSGASRAFVQGVFVEEHRIALLQHFDRCGFGDAPRK